MNPRFLKLMSRIETSCHVAGPSRPQPGSLRGSNLASPVKPTVSSRRLSCTERRALCDRISRRIVLDRIDCWGDGLSGVDGALVALHLASLAAWLAHEGGHCSTIRPSSPARIGYVGFIHAHVTRQRVPSTREAPCSTPIVHGALGRVMEGKQVVLIFMYPRDIDQGLGRSSK